MLLMAYWGDPEKFSFRAKIDSYTTTTELVSRARSCG